MTSPHAQTMWLKMKESYFLAKQEEDQRKSIVQQVPQKSADLWRRIIAPVEGQGRVTLSCVCPLCHRYPLDESFWCGLRRAVQLEGPEQCLGFPGWCWLQRGEVFYGLRATTGSVRGSHECCRFAGRFANGRGQLGGHDLRVFFFEERRWKESLNKPRLLPSQRSDAVPRVTLREPSWHCTPTCNSTFSTILP